MKTKILRGIFALAVMVATGYGVNRSMQKDADLSEMALKNVEALANGENNSDKGILYGTKPDSQGQSHYCCCPGDNSCGAVACSGC